jgi:hypothetical protein
MCLLRTVALAVFALLAFPAASAVTRTLIDVQRPAGLLRILLLTPDVPVATVVMLTGGNGVLGLTSDGTATRNLYAVAPVSRDTQSYLDLGYAVAHVDTVNQANLNNEFRATSAHLADVAAALEQVRMRVDAPLWILGWSAGTISAVNAAVNLPASPPFGIILLASVTVDAGALQDFNLESIRRPSFILTHGLDPCGTTPPANAPTILARLTGAAPREHVQLLGGNPGSILCDASGYHGLGGLDDLVRRQIATWVSKGAPALGEHNFHGLWYRAPAESESGWGVNIAHQGDTLFVTWFTYDTDGSQMWLVGPAVQRTTGNAYSGALFRTTGPAFNSVPFNPAAVAATQVGTVILDFASSETGAFNYVVNGVSQSKPITRQVFGSQPACAAGVGGAVRQFQDLWYAPGGSESGWGVNVTQQGDILFAAWFTYDANGRGMWAVGPRLERTSGDTFAGPLYRTTGPAFSANPWNPAGVAATEVGTATFAFTGPDAGTFSYTVQGVSQSKAIARQVFGTPVTVCR